MIQRISKAEQNNCETQSGPKHCKKSSDLRCRPQTPWRVCPPLCGVHQREL